jgi:glycosyltransferase involved in cell wall biosynthesis
VDFEPSVRVGYPGFRRWKQLLALAAEAATARISRARLIAVSDTVAASVARRLRVRRSEIGVIRNGVDTERFRPDAASRAAVRSRLGIGPESPVVVSIGRLAPEKSQETLMRAALQLLGRHPDLQILIAGDGPRREALIGLSHELGLSARVRFLGSIEDIPGLLNAADVLAHPSLHEGFGLVVVEAMASAVPVVVSRIPALLEIVRDGETGTVCDVADPDALAGAIDRFLRDRIERARCGAAARRDAKARFSLQGMVRTLEAEYLLMVRAGDLIAGGSRGDG